MIVNNDEEAARILVKIYKSMAMRLGRLQRRYDEGRRLGCLSRRIFYEENNAGRGVWFESCSFLSDEKVRFEKIFKKKLNNR